jgi:hypothetical protein
VEAATRLEQIGVEVGASVLASHAFVERLPEDLRTLTRCLGFAARRGAEASLDVYEVFAIDSARTQRHKRDTAAMLTAGVRALRTGEFAIAQKTFARLASSCGDDTASQWWIGQVEQHRIARGEKARAGES